MMMHPQAPYGPNYESKGETTKGKGVGACSLTRNISGVHGRVGVLRWD
jgi:hypothetical protein